MIIKTVTGTLAFLILLSACKSAKNDFASTFWGELEENQNYLFQADSLTAIVDGELNSGSVLLFGEIKGDFHEVYITSDAKYSKHIKTKYYLYKPKYKKIGPYSASGSVTLVRAPIESSRKYLTGERGGCYYVNSNGNRIYVDKSFCAISSPSIMPNKSYQPSISNSSSTGNVHVKGHYRTTKSGKTVYVKPHTRKKD